MTSRFPHGISSMGIPVIGPLLTTGNVFFVDSQTGVDESTAYGSDSSTPFATLAYAISNATANQGDTIIVGEGHAETLTSTIALSKAGLTIIGLGSGDARPTFTINAAINGLTVTAANQKIYNLKFSLGASSTIASKMFAITGGVGMCELIGCHFQIPAGYKMYHLGYVLGAKGKLVTIKDCLFENLSTVTMAGNATLQKNALLIRTGDVNVTNCRFIDMGANKKSKWAACIKAGSTGTGSSLCTINIEGCVFNCRGVAVTCRAAAVSPRLSIVNCRGISTSGNTAVANIFLVTYANVIDSYAIGAVNVRAKMVPAATEA